MITNEFYCRKIYDGQGLKTCKPGEYLGQRV